MQISGSIPNMAQVMPTQINETSKEYVQVNDTPTTIAKDAVSSANEAITKKLTGTRELHFAVHEETKEVMVKVIDKETQDVVREIPSEKLLDMIAKFYEINGLFVDEKR